MKYKRLFNRFVKYAVGGTSSFLMDFLLLFLLASILGVHYLLAAGIGFLLGNVLNYTINRNWGFKDSITSHKKAFSLFFSFATIGIVLTLSLLRLIVENTNVHYLLARIFVAILVGVFSFSMNYLFTFGVRD